MAASSSYRLSLADVNHDTILGIWQRMYNYLPPEDQLQGMLVCKALLAEVLKVVSSIYIENHYPSQEEINSLSKFTACESLTLMCCDEDMSYGRQRSLDLGGIRLPRLINFEGQGLSLKSIHFTRSTTPSLAVLTLEHCSAGGICLDLPALEMMNMQFVDLHDGSNFGSSLSSCPLLESFSSYKLWGLEGPHHIQLPSCVSLELYRSDDLEGLVLEAPALRELNLRACYSLQVVRVEPSEGPPLSVCLINANIDPVSLEYLMGHPRVKEGGIERDEDDADEFYGFGVHPAEADAALVAAMQQQGAQGAGAHLPRGLAAGARHMLLHDVMADFFGDGGEDEDDDDDDGWEESRGEGEEDHPVAAPRAEAGEGAGAGAGAAQ